MNTSHVRITSRSRPPTARPSKKRALPGRVRVQVDGEQAAARRVDGTFQRRWVRTRLFGYPRKRNPSVPGPMKPVTGYLSWFPWWREASTSIGCRIGRSSAGSRRPPGRVGVAAGAASRPGWACTLAPGRPEQVASGEASFMIRGFEEGAE